MMRRCEDIEKLGMECLHNDSRVCFPELPEVEFDLSAIPSDFWFSHGLQQVFEAGERKGQRELKDKFRQLMIED